MKLFTTLALSSTLLLCNCATIGKFRKDPSEWGKGKSASNELAETAKDNKTPKLTAPKLSAPKSNRSTPTVATPSVPNRAHGRTVHGLLEPENVTKLPTADDLKETETATPKNNTPNSIIPQP